MGKRKKRNPIKPIGGFKEVASMQLGPARGQPQPARLEILSGPPGITADPARGNQRQQALELLHRGEHQEAEQIYRHLIAAGDNDASTYGNLAALYGMTGRPGEMRGLLETALKLNPNYPDALSNLGNLLKQDGQLQEAVDLYRKALALDPTHAGANGNLGNALKDLGQVDEALQYYREALKHNPDHWPAHNNLGLTIKDRGDLEGAIACYERALALNPKSAEVLNNLGVAYADRGELERSKEMYVQALGLNPNYAEAHNNLGHTLLCLGDYSAGWREYGWRWYKKHPTLPHAVPQCERWLEGRVLQAGEQVLVISEQGLGDTLHFMRYVLTLRELGVNARVCAQTKLHGVIRASGIDAEPFTPPRAAEISEGLWIPMMTLPARLGVCPQQPIHTQPYIQAPSELVEKWRQKLSGARRPVIGINWQGNPNQEKSNALGRSFALREFEPLAQAGIGSLLSLQKGHGSEQLASCSFREHFVACQSDIDHTWDFAETSAIVANCDLVISSDTAVAHLAGGMGQPTWVLLKHTPEWRWGNAGDRSFWYPSMRLFRQPQRDDWRSVIKATVSALKQQYRIG